MKVLVTGGMGMAAQDLAPALERAGHALRAVGRGELDITDPAACRAAVTSDIDVVVNAAAYTAVDAAESDEQAAFAVNALGPANLAAAADAVGAALVQISTDYVFPGDGDRAWRVDDPVAPRSAYGRTKVAGEWAALAGCERTWVVRTAWLYGAGGPNFVRTMADLATNRETLTVVDDQVGQPTWTVDLADAIVRLIGDGVGPDDGAPYGIHHASSQGSTSWCGLAKEVFTGLGLDPDRVRPVTSAEFVRPAARPANSVLDHSRWDEIGLAKLPEWRESLRRALPTLGLANL